ncbi:MAG: FIST C-terminal domain-containing protein [Bacteroidetes bacterium]|nr:FIST C-terminal domain-containing protein [Bacteroidota bacterium]
MNTKTLLIRQVINLEQQLAELSEKEFNPTLAIVFSSPVLPLTELVKTLVDKQIAVVGASSCGEIFGDVERVQIADSAAVIMLLDIDPTAFKVYFKEGTNGDCFLLGSETAKLTLDGFEKQSLIVLASGMKTDGQALVEGMVEVLGSQIPIFGGLAGDDAVFKETWVFCNNQFSNQGVVVLSLDQSKIEVTGMATSGWISLGADLKVTSSVGNVVYHIDGQPALDMYMKYLSVLEDDLPGVGVEYPLMIKRSDGETAQRAVMAVDKEARSLVFAGSVPENSIVNFSSSPGFEVIEFTRKNIEAFDQGNLRPDCCLLFSCMARHLALGPLISDEVHIALKKWQAPLAGFFTYGEIGTNPNHQCDFYNQTFTIALLKQKD